MCFTNFDFYENTEVYYLDGKLYAHIGKSDRKIFYTQEKNLSHITPLNLTLLDHFHPD